jgi:hypothetical protein
MRHACVVKQHTHSESGSLKQRGPVRFSVSDLRKSGPPPPYGMPLRRVSGSRAKATHASNEALSTLSTSLDTASSQGSPKRLLRMSIPRCFLIKAWIAGSVSALRPAEAMTAAKPNGPSAMPVIAAANPRTLTVLAVTANASRLNVTPPPTPFGGWLFMATAAPGAALAGSLKFAAIPSANPCANAAPAGGETFALVDSTSAPLFLICWRIEEVDRRLHLAVLAAHIYKTFTSSSS